MHPFCLEETGYSLFISSSRLKSASSLYRSVVAAAGSGEELVLKNGSFCHVSTTPIRAVIDLNHFINQIIIQTTTQQSSSTQPVSSSILILDCYYQLRPTTAFAPQVSIIHPHSTQSIISHLIGTSSSNSACPPPHVVVILAPDCFKWTELHENQHLNDTKATYADDLPGFLRTYSEHWSTVIITIKMGV